MKWCQEVSNINDVRVMHFDFSWEEGRICVRLLERFLRLKYKDLSQFIIVRKLIVSEIPVSKLSVDNCGLVATVSSSLLW